MAQRSGISTVAFRQSILTNNVYFICFSKMNSK